MATLEQWADAIFHYEGGKPGDLNVRNNNPGNLKFAHQPHALCPDARGFAMFPTMATGREALVADLQSKLHRYSGWSMLQVMTRYLGGDPQNPVATGEGNPFHYASYIATRLGVKPSDTLAEIFADDPRRETLKA